METTGTWLERDRIVEIAMVRFLPDGAKETYKSRVNPQVKIPRRVSQIIGITDDDVKDAPTFKQLAADVFNFIGEAELAGFNIERFDMLILERELFDAGIKFEWRNRVIYDAQRIYHLHEKRTLKAAYHFYCSKELTNAHTALGDTEATIEILAAQIERYGKPEHGIVSLRDFKYEEINDFFDKERKFRWWNGELYPIFGKYARKMCIKDIAKKEPSYLEWLISTDFSAEVKTMLKAALEGRFPLPPNGVQ